MSVAWTRRVGLTACVGFDFQAAYDDLNAADHDYRFYADLATSLRVRRALDLGCGTGTLARLMATRGIDVVGVDPDPDMIRVARSKTATEQVDWRLGYSHQLESAMADFAVMSGHVAQVFVDDDAWQSALGDLHRALVPGGTLTFEARNPSARAWEEWTRGSTSRTVETTDGTVELWHQTISVDLPLVSYETRTRNVRNGECTTTRDVLAFRDEGELRASVERAGFTVTHVFGDWNRTLPSVDSPELIVIARRQ